MRDDFDDLSLGAGNVVSWLRDRGKDLTRPRLYLDLPWIGPDGTSRVSLSLEDILNFSASYRRMYEKLGIAPGNVVVIRFKTAIEVYLHWVALTSIGAIGAPVNPNLDTEVVFDYGRRLKAVGALFSAWTGKEILDTTDLQLCWIPSPFDVGSSPLQVSPRLDSTVAATEYSHRPEDIVLLCHTSGTTGKPKAVAASHYGFLVGVRNELRQATSPLLGSCMLNALPAAHMSSLATITWALLSDTRLVLVSDQSARTLVSAVENFKPDSITSFSCTLRDVAKLGLPPGSLRSVGLWMTTGDASRQRDITTVSALGTHPVASQDGVERAAGMFVLDCFGSSELGHMHFSALHAPGHACERRCIGRPVSFVTAAILDENGRELAEGEIGYLAVKSGSITPGYWNEPERTAASRLANFWMTGDVGYRDAFGRYYHLDRHSDVIETHDGPVYSVCSEEELLRAIPKIQRCAVVGRRDESGLVRAVCVIESDDVDREAGRWNREVNAALAAASLTPVAETIVLPSGSLPVGPTGKIRKFLVRAQLSATAV